MKAPDKIYINGFNAFATEPVKDGIEYIRKDALLEWAKEMKGQVSIGLNAYDMGEENGKAEILNALIDKLNSM